MYSNFGHKWVCMQHGSGFAYEEQAEGILSGASSTSESPSCESTPQVGLLQQAWEGTFGNSAGLSLPENDVMKINPTSANAKW